MREPHRRRVAARLVEVRRGVVLPVAEQARARAVLRMVELRVAAREVVVQAARGVRP